MRDASRWKWETAPTNFLPGTATSTATTTRRNGSQSSHRRDPHIRSSSLQRSRLSIFCGAISSLRLQIIDFLIAAKRLEHQRSNSEWQRVRDSNPCFSLESAYAFHSEPWAVERLLTEFGSRPRPLHRIAPALPMIADESTLAPMPSTISAHVEPQANDAHRVADWRLPLKVAPYCLWYRFLVLPISKGSNPAFAVTTIMHVSVCHRRRPVIIRHATACNFSLDGFHFFKVVLDVIIGVALQRSLVPTQARHAQAIHEFVAPQLQIGSG